MISFDTNIVVRAIVSDDLSQSQIAKQLFSQTASVFLTKSVVLESFWVLSHNYKFKKNEAIFQLISLCCLENVYLEDEDNLLYALDAATNGLDFADAMHLYSSNDASSLVTFDKKFIKAASKLENSLKVVSP
jgi:predicted nucleic-acid-binding protein